MPQQDLVTATFHGQADRVEECNLEKGMLLQKNSDQDYYTQFQDYIAPKQDS